MRSVLAAFGLGLAAPALGQAPPPGSAPAPPAPVVPAGPEARAREAFAARDFDRALRELQEAAKANPRLTPPRVLLATYFDGVREGSAARQNLETAAAEDPKHPEVYLLNASFALREGRATDAVLSCQTAIALAAEPRWDAEQRKRFIREGHRALAIAFEGRRDFPAARDQLAILLADDPKDSFSRVKLGSVLFAESKPEEAFAQFQQAAKDDPAVPQPELQMAGLYGGARNFEQAEAWYKRAVTAAPNSTKAHTGYGSFLLDQGRAAEAQPYLDTVAKLADPRDREAVLQASLLRGLLFRHQKNYAAAEPIFEEAHRELPNNKFAAYNLAIVLAESADKNKVRRAVEVAEGEVRKNEADGEAYSILGYAYHKAGRPDDALRAGVAATQKGPLTPDSGYFLARSLFDAKRYADAAQVLKAGETAAALPFLYRAEAKALLADATRLAPAAPAPKK